MPKYLRMPAFGFDLSDRSLKYVLLEGNKNSLVASSFGERLIPEGVLESGEIKKSAELISFLKAIREEIRSDYCVVSLPEEKAFLVAVQIPQVNYKEIRNTIELQIEEYVPLKAEEVIFDFNIFEFDGTAISLNVTAYPSAFILSYQNVFRQAGFMPIAFEMEMQAASRAVTSLLEEFPVMVVDFGKTRTSLGIVFRGETVYTSTIGVAGKDLNQAIAKSLGVDSFRAEEIKRQKGFVKSGDNQDVFQAMLPVISAVKEEIFKHMEYWESHGSLRIKAGNKMVLKKLILLGGESNIKGFAEYLSYELKIRVTKGNPWENIVSLEEHIPEIDLETSLAFSTAIGLAIRGSNLK